MAAGLVAFAWPAFRGATHVPRLESRVAELETELEQARTAEAQERTQLQAALQREQQLRAWGGAIRTLVLPAVTRGSAAPIPRLELRAGQTAQPIWVTFDPFSRQDPDGETRLRIEIFAPQAATAAWDPVFDGQWVEKGMYVASIGGSDASNKRREIDDETIRRADLYIVHSKEVAKLDKSPDIWEAAEKGIKSWDSIHEIQELLAGNVRGRTRVDEITLFNNNTGAGTQFAALGSVVLRKAREMGLGKEIPTEWFLEDVSP